MARPRAAGRAEAGRGGEGAWAWGAAAGLAAAAGAGASGGAVWAREFVFDAVFAVERNALVSGGGGGLARCEGSSGRTSGGRTSEARRVTKAGGR